MDDRASGIRPTWARPLRRVVARLASQHVKGEHVDWMEKQRRFKPSRRLEL